MRIATLASLVFLLGANAGGAEPANVVLLLADDLGYGELGCYGGTEVPTPHIDSLARDGVRFTSGYVTAPFCAASRASLLTGKYQTRFGFEFNPIGARNADPSIGLPPEERTIADHLRDLGYVTGLVGKWHLGGTAACHPQRRGFDEFYGFLHEGHYYVPPPWEGVTTWLRRKHVRGGEGGRWTSPDGRIVWSSHLNSFEPPYDADNPVLRGSQPVEERAHLTDAIAREALSFIERHRAEPFFLYVAFNAVHSPMQGADEYMERFAHIEDVHRRIFAAMLAHLDDAVGRILDKLREWELVENTVVVFLSDNGGPTRELTSSNRPLRGEKGQLYEGGIRVPFLIRWPGRVPSGQVDDRPIVSLDLPAMFLSAAGSDNQGRYGDGRELFGQGREPIGHDSLYWRVGPNAALRQGDWKIVRHSRRAGPPAAWELYNLREDIGESNNLAGERPERVAELAEIWERWDRQMAAPRWR